MPSSDLSQYERLSRLMIPVYGVRKVPTVIPTPRWDDDTLLCLKINDEWASHLIGMLIALDQPDTWIGTDEEIYDARQQVNEIILALMEGCDPLSNCCPTPLIQMQPDGSIYVSYDGGVTYNPSTTEDPRVTSPQLPPLPTTGSFSGDRCRAANNALRQFKENQINFKNQLGAGLTVLQLALAFAGAVAVLFLTGGTLAAILVPALLSLAAAIVGTGATAYDDLFTSDVWDTVLCSLYCNSQSDGTYTQGNFNNILAQLDTDLSGNVALTMSSIMRAWQLQGLNQAAKTPSTENNSCDDCECDGCDPTRWTIFNGTEDYGTVVEYGADYIIADLQFAPTTVGEYYLRMKTGNINSCCRLTGWEVVSGGSMNISAYGLCGEAQTDGGSISLGMLDGTGDTNTANRISFGATGACRVKIKF